MKNKMIAMLIVTLLFYSCSETGKLHHGNESVNKSKTGVIGDTVSQPGNNIMVIYQDKKNNYWMGSWEDGLYKYDGKVVLHYTTEQGLPSNRVEEIKEDESGNLYFNTSGGIIKYDGDRFIKLQVSIGDIESWALSNNDIWFKNFTDAQSVFRYDGIVLHQLKIPKVALGEEWIEKNPSSLNPYAIYCTYKDSKGHVWFGTAAIGVFRYDGTKFDWITENDVTELHYGPSNGVRSIAEDKDGCFWFNSNYRYKITDNNAISGTPFYERQKSIGNLDGKPDSNINEYLSIVKDDENNLWIATYVDGVWKYDGTTVRHYAVQENGKDIKLFYVYNDKQGTIWLGTHENGVWSLKGDTFVRLVL